MNNILILAQQYNPCWDDPDSCAGNDSIALPVILLVTIIIVLLIVGLVHYSKTETEVRLDRERELQKLREEFEKKYKAGDK